MKPEDVNDPNNVLLIRQQDRLQNHGIRLFVQHLISSLSDGIGNSHICSQSEIIIHMSKYLEPIEMGPDDENQGDENTLNNRKKWYLDWLVLWPSDWNNSNSPDLTQTIIEDLAEFAGGYGPYWETMNPRTKPTLKAHIGHPITLELKDLITEYYEKRNELIKRMDGSKSRAVKEIQEQYMEMFGQKAPEKRIGKVPTVHEIVHDDNWNID